MTKAQKIRQNRQENLNKDISEKAVKIFDWILDKLDERVNNLDYDNTIRIYKYKDSYKLFFEYDNEPCDEDLKFFFFYHDEVKLFKELQKLFHNEEGFKADLNLDKWICGDSAIVLSVKFD